MDLDRLERVAREASPGPWAMTRDVKRGVKVWSSHGRKPLFTTIHGLDGSHVTEDDPNPQWLKDCDYLLATDPHDVLALIDRLRKAERVVEAARLKRNKRITNRYPLVGEWVAVPRADFLALREALDAYDREEGDGGD